MTAFDFTRHAQEWIVAWNARDLERILAHYSEDVELTSPFVAKLTGRKDGQIASRLQSLNAADVATTGAQEIQAQHVLLCQWPNRLLQCLADGCVEAGVGNKHFLCQRGGYEVGQNEQGQNKGTA